ncbi:MAG: copper resistance protein CopC [Acetobacteraceae bacterium]|nr:copper resistance protein CopC [Acetobacteraceae bacterium]
MQGHHAARDWWSGLAFRPGPPADGAEGPGTAVASDAFCVILRHPTRPCPGPTDNARPPTPAAPQEIAPLPPVARRFVLPASAALALSALPPARRASAHALVVEADPAGGAVFSGEAPHRVRLRFNSPIDRARSRLVLHAPNGGQTPLPLDSGNDPTLLEARTAIVPWSPGAWRLLWQVLALDGQITRGDVPFTLRAP